MDKNVIFDKHIGGHFENVIVKPCTTLQVYYRSIMVWEGPLYDINTVVALHKGGWTELINLPFGRQSIIFVIMVDL